MKILINATTLVAGGGVQVGVSFIQHLCKNKLVKHDYMFAVSDLVYHNLSDEIKKDSRLVLVTPSPAKVVSGYKSRKKILNLEKRFRPDIIYSAGSPSYTRFKCCEIARFTDPWVTHMPRFLWRMLSFSKKIRIFLIRKYKLMWLKRIRYIETQSQTAKEGLVRHLGLQDSSVMVIPNACNELFLNSSTLIKPADNLVNIFCIAAPYWHKNLSIIPDVALDLKIRCPEKIFKFIVTLSGNSNVEDDFWEKVRALGVSDYIINIGRITLNECLEWYARCDLVFLPTLLETFSVTYLEAMAMGRPIVTTDLDFARETCGNAALYFRPLSSKDATETILSLITDESLKQKLVNNGFQQLKSYPKFSDKYSMVIEWIETVHNRVSQQSN